MRWILSLAACATLMTAGCEKADPDLKPRGPINLSHSEVNRAMIQSYHLEHVDNAVIRQHTLYAYHFVPHSAQFNDLGMREAYVLARHYRTNPGPLNLHQGDESNAIYQARIGTLRQFMIDHGVAAERVAISDGMPGGDGLPADQVVIVLRRMAESRLSGASAPIAASAGRPELNQAQNMQSEGTTQP